MEIVKIKVGVVKRTRSKKVAELEKAIEAAIPTLLTVTPTIVTSGVQSISRQMDRYMALPERSARNFYGFYGEKKKLSPDASSRQSIEELYRKGKVGTRIDGCSCKDENPPVANLDVWACLVHDPKQEIEESEHSHIREWIDGGIKRW